MEAEEVAILKTEANANSSRKAAPKNQALGQLTKEKVLALMNRATPRDFTTETFAPADGETEDKKTTNLNTGEETSEGRKPKKLPRTRNP